MIKIDVEGSEFDVLKGAENALKKFHPILLLEVRFREIKEKIIHYLERFNYKIVYQRVWNTSLKEG